MLKSKRRVAVRPGVVPLTVDGRRVDLRQLTGVRVEARGVVDRGGA